MYADGRQRKENTYKFWNKKVEGQGHTDKCTGVFKKVKGQGHTDMSNHYLYSAVTVTQ